MRLPAIVVALLCFAAVDARAGVVEEGVARTLALAAQQRQADPTGSEARDAATPPAELSQLHNPAPHFEAFWHQQYRGQAALAFERLWKPDPPRAPGLVDGLLLAISEDPVDRPLRLRALMQRYVAAESLAAEHAGEVVAASLLVRARDERRTRLDRVNAALALGKTRSRDATIRDALIALAIAPAEAEELRAAAAESACALGLADPAPLLTLLAETDRQSGCCTLRERTAQALQKSLGAPRFVQELAVRAAATREAERHGAAYALRFVERREALPLLARLLTDPALAVRREAIQAAMRHAITARIARQKIDESFRGVLRQVEAKDKDAEVRALARSTLGHLGE